MVQTRIENIMKRFFEPRPRLAFKVSKICLILTFKIFSKKNWVPKKLKKSRSYVVFHLLVFWAKEFRPLTFWNISTDSKASSTSAFFFPCGNNHTKNLFCSSSTFWKLWSQMRTKRWEQMCFGIHFYIHL